MADTWATVLLASSAHHAQRSPRRKAVTVMAIAISAKTALKTPYIRNRRTMYLAASGAVPTRSDHEPPEKPAYPAGGIGVPPGPGRRSGHAAAATPQAPNPASAMRMRIQAIWRRVMWVVSR